MAKELPVSTDIPHDIGRYAQNVEFRGKRRSSATMRRPYEIRQRRENAHKAKARSCFLFLAAAQLGVGMEMTTVVGDSVWNVLAHALGVVCWLAVATRTNSSEPTCIGL
jgi:hypothetical protein